jgi:lysophospholipase L1-like esterase
VAAHLRARLPAAEWTVQLRAVDGSIVSQVPTQLAAAAIEPSDVLVMSAGGNDALGSIELLSDPRPYTFSQMLAHLYKVKEAFRAAYAATLDALLAYQRPTVVCTVYNPRFDEELLQHTAEAALSIFNDVIMQEAVRRRVPMIDLRLICTEPAHFANPIEPSNEGGARIAEAIVAAATRLGAR